MILSVFGLLGSVVLCLSAIAVIRTLALRKTPGKPGPSQDPPVIADEIVQEAALHLAQAVALRTIAHERMDETDSAPFHVLHALLRKFYPRMHGRLEIIDAGPRNLLFRWKGADESLLPALLAAHQDVVPASDADQWTFPPFSSTIESGYVWGRGSFDAKGQLIAICEAVEQLLAAGFSPERTWYIAFGCDEEIRGSAGAARMASLFTAMGIRFSFVLDEGGVVAQRFLSALDRPIAVVGIAEKGDVQLTLSCTKAGGHSSSPENPTALALIGKAAWRIESRRTAVRLTVPVRHMIRTLGVHAPFPLAFVLLNLWLTKPIVMRIFSKNPAMNALIRSTCTVTMAKGSEAPNVVPTVATATVNVRILPGVSAEQMVARIGRRIADKRIVVKIEEDSRRSVASPIDSAPFAHICRAIATIFPSSIPTPYLMTGGTDALWYEQLSDCVYRFTPAMMDSGELKRMHNRDERFAIANMEKAMQFYMALIMTDRSA